MPRHNRLGLHYSLATTAVSLVRAFYMSTFNETSKQGVTALAAAIESHRTAEGGAEVQATEFLNNLRSSVSDSAEFRALASRLYAGVRDALREGNMPSFGTLSRGAQEALVNEVRGQLLADEVYARCRDATWRALDAAYATVARASARLGGPAVRAWSRYQHLRNPHGDMQYE